MSRERPDSLRDAQRRIQDLELALEQSRRLNESYLQALGRVTASLPWRLSAPARATAAWLRTLRRKHVGDEAPAAIVAGEIVDDQSPVGQLLAVLPPEALLDDSAAATGANSCQLMDLSGPMRSMLGDRCEKLLSLEAADADTVQMEGRRSPARIAFLGSSALMRELAFESDITPLHEHAWWDQLSPDRFDLLLVETVWHVDNREWRYFLTVDGNGRPLLQRMLGRCHDLGIPIVLWYRESDANYSHFAWLADHANAIYSVEESTATRFAADYPDRKVGWLPPAVQPVLHNPVLPAALAKAARAKGSRVLLDGWASLANRSDANKHHLLSGIPGLLVAESRWDVSRNTLREHRREHRGNILGCLGAVDRLAISRLVGAELFEDDSSRPNWRGHSLQLQAAAGGALPVGPAASLNAGPGSYLISDPIERSRQSHRLFRTVFSGHCIAHRLQRIADDLRLPLDFLGAAPDIACLLVTMRPQLVPDCIERFRRDIYPHKELIIVVHQQRADLDSLRSHIRGGERVRIFKFGEDQILGACLNFAFAQTAAPYWCKMDDDDFYGPHYLSDFMLYRRAVDFDVAGKPMAFTLLDEPDELRWDRRWAERANLLKTGSDVANTGVAGATLMGHRRVLEATPFPERRRRGTDSEFLRVCHEHGWNLLSTDPFNFVRYRTEQDEFHTWQLGHDAIRERTVMVGSRAEMARIAFI